MNSKKSLHIGRVVRDAAVFDLKKWNDGGSMGARDLLQTVARFFELLREREVDYVLVGGVALLQYVEGRNTEDLDLIMAASSLEKLPEVEITERDPNFVRASFQGLQIDVLRTRHVLFDKVRRDYAVERRFREQEIRCATVEGLLLLKLYALPSLYRQGDFTRVGLYENDVATLLHAYDPDLESLVGELQEHLSITDLNEVRTIIDEIGDRLDRFRKRANDQDAATNNE